MIGQQLVNLKGGDPGNINQKRAILFPIDSIDGPSPSQYCAAIQDITTGLVFNSVCHTIDPAKGVTEESVMKSFNAMVLANGGAAPAPNSLGELPGKPDPEPQPVPPAPERTAPPRKR